MVSSTSLDLLSEAQQQNPFSGISAWIWLVVALIVIIIGVIWTLYEEGEFGRKREKARSPVEPEATAPVKPAATEPSEPVTAPVEPEVTEPSEPTGVPEAEKAIEATPEPPPEVRPDNLKRVKGIGPKIEKLLKDNGITTFVQLAQTEVSRLQALLDQAEYTLADPVTWPEQARQFIKG